MDVRFGLWRKLSAKELMLLNCGVGEDSWESLGLQGDPTSPFCISALGFLWKEWCWSWNSSTLATLREELTFWKRLWCWEGLEAGGEGDDRGWDGWMASLTRWMWIWMNSGSCWWTGRPGMLRLMGLQRVGHDWVTELNWCCYDYTSVCLVSNYGHFCFFQFGAIINKVAKNITSFCGHKFLCLLGKYLGLGLPGHRVSKYLFIYFILFNFTILYWFCHTSKLIHHRYTCVPHPEPSSLPIPSLWVVPVHQPQAYSIVHRTWTGDPFHIWYYTCFNAILLNHPTLSLSHRVQKSVLYFCVSFAISYTGLLLPSF